MEPPARGFRGDRHDWPLTDTGLLSTSGKVWEEMADRYSEMQPYVEIDSLKNNLKGRLDLKVGSDGRSRPPTLLYCQKTSRTSALKGSVFTKSRWLRFLILPGKGEMLLYADYSQQEPAVAAYLSQDPVLAECYHSKSGSFYIGLMQLAGLAPMNASKANSPDLHEKGKTLLLAVTYGARDTGAPDRLRKDMLEGAELVLPGFGLRAEVKVIRYPDHFKTDPASDHFAKMVLEQLGRISTQPNPTQPCTHSPTLNVPNRRNGPVAAGSPPNVLKPCGQPPKPAGRHAKRQPDGLSSKSTWTNGGHCGLWARKPSASC